MMQFTIQRCLLVSLTVLLFACSGDEEITDFVDAPDLRLSSLTVLSGGTLYFGGNIVEEFDPEVAGPYSVELDDAETSISLSVSLGENENVRLELIEVSNDENQPDTVTSISADDSISVDLEEGVNLVYLRVSSRSNAAVLDYSLRIERVSSSAELQNVVIGGLLATNLSLDNFSPEFSPETFEYNISLNSSACGVSFLPLPESRFANITFQGELRDWKDSVFLPLEAGETDSIQASVVSQVGGDPITYTFNFSRAEESAEEAASDTRLSALTLSGGRATTGFTCASASGATIATYRLSAVAQLGLTASMYSDSNRTGSVITLGVDDADKDNDETVIDEDTAEVLTSGAEYTGSLFDNLEVGSNIFLLRVDAADGDNSSLYSINIVVTETNEVYVSTTSELQTALQSATSNTEIIVASGEYEGLASVSTSGHDDAHFYAHADNDVTADEPIIVRAESGEVVLSGNAASTSSVLLIEGDYWQIEGIDISGARNGIVVDGASGVVLENIDIDSVSERGIVFQNSTSNSHVLGGSIDRTGLNPRDGLDEIYGEGVVIGVGEGDSENNSVREVVFGRNISNEHIELKDNSSGTSIQFNMFESDNTLIRPFESRSLVSVAGSAEISYNEFEFDGISGGTDEIQQVINVSTEAAANVVVFQNYFDLDDQTITAVNNGGAGTVTIADNQRRDSGVLTVSDLVSVAETPIYQIQSTLDASQCLSVESIVANTETIENIVVAVDCDDSLASQQWVFLHTDGGYVHITLNSEVRDTKLYFRTLEASRVASVREDLVLEDDTTFKNQSYDLQWLLKYSGENVSFSNRGEAARFLLESFDPLAEGVDLSPKPAFVGGATDSFVSEFQLIAL